MPKKNEPQKAAATKKRGAAVQIRMDQMPYGLKFTLPATVGEGPLLTLFLRIPDRAYALPEDQGVVLDFQDRACSQALLANLLSRVVWGKGVPVLAWLSTNPQTLALFRRSGLSVQEPGPQAPRAQEAGIHDGPRPAPRPLSTARAAPHRPAARFFYSSKRSGDRIEADGDVVLWGHLNAGAEVAAGGSVIVAGRLRGLVHAGQDGQEDAFILAGAFEAPQVRIGHLISYAEEGGPWWGKPVLITLGEDGALNIRENNLLAEPRESSLNLFRRRKKK